METEEANTAYMLVHENVDPQFDEPSVVEFAARERDTIWTLAINGDMKEERAVEGLPGRNSETTIHPNQILVFLGETHVGTLGMGHGEFYEENFEDAEEQLLAEMLNDLHAEFD